MVKYDAPNIKILVQFKVSLYILYDLVAEIGLLHKSAKLGYMGSSPIKV